MKQKDVEGLRRLLAAQKEFECEVVSGSMMPLIKIGDTIRVASCPFAELKLFDVVLFFAKGKLICHFIVHKNYFDKSLLTIGLQGNWPDLPVSEAEYIGKVVNFELSLLHKLSFWLRKKLFSRRRL